MADSLEKRILATLAHRRYTPLKPKALARKLGLPEAEYPQFKRLLRQLIAAGRVELGRNDTLRAPKPFGTVVGIFRRTPSGHGYVRPHAVDGLGSPEITIADPFSTDASTGDEVLVKILRKPGKRGHVNGLGEVLRVMQRATQQFVGTYHERNGEGLVRVAGTVFNRSIFVGDPGAKGAKPDDQVVIEMIRFPTPEARGEGVIVEVLGPRGQSGVDVLTVIRTYQLPEEFSPEALEEARDAVARYREDDFGNREDFTHDLVITIDPIDARDFDDAISLTFDPHSKQYTLTVHIADVAYFAPPGSALDREARKRGTSVYLPGRVLPMFPELISNGLASLQPQRVRYVKSVVMTFAEDGIRTSVRFANGVIRSKHRFTYEQVTMVYADPQAARSAQGEATPTDPGRLEPETIDLLLRMRDLARVLHRKRLARGALELHMPEAVLEYDDAGRVCGAHFAVHDESHQVIEEFMLAANEAVAQHLSDLEVPFLRRVHPLPDPLKLRAFAEFVEALGYTLTKETDRFQLQRILRESRGRPDEPAVHYALLRSLKQASYSPIQEEHFALASTDYCHFTSPIRRYPDLTVHRLLDQWLKRGKVSADETEMIALGEHCNKMERRAENAERDLIRLKLLTYLSERLGEQLLAVITGVADYGFFAQGEQFPVEGLVHISTLADDYYFYDEATHSLFGRRTKRRYRLGDRVTVEVVHVDLNRRQLDFRLVDTSATTKVKRLPR